VGEYRRLRQPCGECASASFHFSGSDASREERVEIETGPSRGNCGGWIHSRPSAVREPDLAPGMGVGLSHEKESAQIVVLTPQIADDNTRGNSSQPHQGGETGGVMFAKSDSTMKEKLVQIVLLVFAWRQ